MRRNTGFTAIELMVVIAIAAILAALALPSFDHLIKKWQFTKDINTLKDTIYLARSEAVKWGGDVRMVKYTPPSGCVLADNDVQDWSCGWQIVFTTVPAGAANPIRLIETNAKNFVMARAKGGVLNLNRWGNPDAGFSINVKHARDNSLEKCLNLSSGGRLDVVDGGCP